MKMHAISFNHLVQWVELASSRARFRIQNQRLSAFTLAPGLPDGWTLKQVQGDGK